MISFAKRTGADVVLSGVPKPEYPLKMPAFYRWILLVLVLAAQILPTVARAQTWRLNAGWPAFDYDGKPAQTDSGVKTTVPGSQTETAQFAAE